jgi:hypothetical protein
MSSVHNTKAGLLMGSLFQPHLCFPLFFKSLFGALKKHSPTHASFHPKSEQFTISFYKRDCFDAEL